MAIVTWTAGATLATNTAVFGTEVNSLASGNAVLSSVQVDNSTNGDKYAAISFALASSAFAAPGLIAFWVYPLNQDGTTYGDSGFGSSAAGPPLGGYCAGVVQIPAATQAQTGDLWNIPIPFGKFKFVMYNQGGVALASSGNTIKALTYNTKVA